MKPFPQQDQDDDHVQKNLVAQEGLGAMEVAPARTAREATPNASLIPLTILITVPRGLHQTARRTMTAVLHLVTKMITSFNPIQYLSCFTIQILFAKYQYTDNQLFEGDMAGLFGVFSDLFMEPGVDPSVTRPPTATAPPQMLPALQTRADDLRSQLFSQHKKCQTTSSFPGGDFPMDSAKVVFTANNFDDCVWAYFTFFHPQHPFIHWPTFDVNKVSLPLLLSVVFTGSVHCTPTDAAWSTRFFFDLGEDLIFEQLRNVVAKNDRHDDCVLQIVQACLLIIASQISFNDEAVRRRIRISRHPELVASIRSLELTKPICKSSLDVSEWRMFITEESRVRSIHIMFLMDCMSTFFFNTLPQMAVSEMHQHLPCNDELFEASTPEEFARLSIKSPRSADGTPSIKQLVSWLMSEDWSGPDDPIFDVIESRHLMICIFALHSIIFVSRAALLVSSSYRLLLRALSRWKEIWDAWYARRDAEQKKAIGFTKYGVELWWVARKVLELAHVGDIHSRYMAGTPTDSVRELHEFIEKYAKYKDT
ncbi:Nn.00g090710.m01.CDS01 [Neocucurbitaria sp. VM-36]